MGNESEVTLQKWQESAFFWEKHREMIRLMFSPITDAMLASSGIQSGSTLLDIGGGTGEPSLTIALKCDQRVRIVCTDPIGPMMKAALDEAKRLSIPCIQFCQCNSRSLPFADDCFDAAVARLSAMFFPDPLVCLAEIIRVVRRGGRLIFAVWSYRERNPMFHLVLDVVNKYIPISIEPPGTPGAFRFAERGNLAGLLRKAGASNVREEVVAFQIEAPVAWKDFWTLRSEMSDTLRDKLALLTVSQREAVAADVQSAVVDYFSQGSMRFPAEVIVVSASVL